MINIVNLTDTDTTLTEKYIAGGMILVLCDATNDSFAITLPNAKNSVNSNFIVKKTDSSANTVTINTTSSQTIDGESSIVLNNQYENISVVSDKSNWHETIIIDDLDASAISGLDDKEILYGNATGNIAQTDTFVYDYATGFLGIGEASPGTMLDIASTVPYVTLHNTTHENTDGGRENKFIFEGEKGDGTLGTLGELEF